MENVESRRRDILDAVMSLFNRQPFEDIGIREIAREADVSCGTIYRYFTSQDELYLETLALYMDVVREIVDTHFDAVQKLREGEESTHLAKIADLAVGFLLGNPAAFRIICYFMVTRSLDPGTLNTFETLHRDFFRMLDTLLVKAGSDPHDHDLFPLFLASIFGAVLMVRNMSSVAKEDVLACIRSHIDPIVTVFRHGREPGAQSS